MEAVKDFFYMDGYWLFVWASYAIALVVMLGHVVGAKLCRREVLRSVRRRSRLERRHHEQSA